MTRRAGVDHTAVVFDVGGVLVESPFHAALRWQRQVGLPDAALGTLLRHYATVPGPGEQPPPWHRVETGHLPLADFVAIVAADLRTELGPDIDLPDIGPGDFDLYLHVPALWPTVALARRLGADGYRLAICTNNVAEWGSWRDSVPLELFDVVVDSCEVGVRKPDPAIYRLTCDRLGVPPSATVFCDDHPANVEAAEAFGMTGVHVTDDLVESLDRLEVALARKIGTT